MIAIYKVTLNDGDWYMVFAKSVEGAITLVRSNHYPELTRGVFKKTYSPLTRRVPDEEIVTVGVESEDGSGQIEQRTKRAVTWCEGETVGLFSSNTYAD